MQLAVAAVPLREQHSYRHRLNWFSVLWRRREDKVRQILIRMAHNRYTWNTLSSSSSLLLLCFTHVYFHIVRPVVYPHHLHNQIKVLIEGVVVVYLDDAIAMAV
jgi:hypothetical protein